MRVGGRRATLAHGLEYVGDDRRDTFHRAYFTERANAASNVTARGAHGGEKGEIAFLGCHLGPTLPVAPFDAELVRASIKTKANTFKATLKGTSFFADDSPELGTCKYSYKRQDTNDPGLSACP